MNHPFHHRRLGEILAARGFVDPAQVQQALLAEKGLLGERLVEAGFVSPEQLAEGLAEQFDLPYADLEGFTVPPELFGLLTASQAYENGVVPLRLEKSGVLEVATADPRDYTLAEKLEEKCRRRVRLVLSSARAIAESMRRSEGIAEVLKDVSEDFRYVKENEQGQEEAVSLDSIEDAGSPVIKLVNTVLRAALQKRASDVHIETYEQGVAVKYRIDGVLYPATEILDRRHHSAVVSRLKVMSELDIAEKRIPQDGRYKLRLNGRDIDFRVSILPSIFGEDVVIRILDKSSITEGIGTLSLDSLGIAPEVVKKFRRSIREPYGMILITGPTGSGKTTTLYAGLNELNAGEEKIITIEDPVEYQLDGIIQIPVNEKKNLTFARGLRSILRHDPDKIMIGEIRDSETVQIAVQSALTGHLVFTTVHANNAFDVINRFAHMGVDVHSFVSSLNCVVAQRLVRKICKNCKEPAKVDGEQLELSGLDPHRHRKQVWYEGQGCNKCSGTGYRGRAAVTEFLDLSLRIREMVIARRPVGEMQAQAVKEGMTTLRASALEKAFSGETSLREVNRVTFVE